MYVMIGSIIAIVCIVVFMNFILLFLRMRKNSTRMPSRPALEEEKAVEQRDKVIQGRLDREQDEAEKYIMKRNKTLALYDEVRRRAAATDAVTGVEDKTSAASDL